MIDKSDLIAILDEDDGASGESFAFIFISWAIFLSAFCENRSVSSDKKSAKASVVPEVRQPSFAEIVDDLLEQLFDLLAIFVGCSPVMMDLVGTEKKEAGRKANKQNPLRLLSRCGWFAQVRQLESSARSVMPEWPLNNRLIR